MAMEEQARREMGARILKLRETGGHNQQAIADFCEVRLRTYQLWQAGDTVPKGENLQRLAKFFDVAPRFILCGDAPTPDVLGALNGDLSDQLKRMVEQVGEIHELLLGDNQQLLAGLADRLLAGAGLTPPQADDQDDSPPEARRRNGA